MNSKIRNQFPMLKNNPDLIYLDNANTTFKPATVIRAIDDYYRKYCANVGRASYSISALATEAIADSRQAVANFISAKSADEIIFTYSSTYAINQIAFGIKHLLQPGDIILLTLHEHNSNLIPWLKVAQDTGAEIKYVDELDRNQWDDILPRVKMFSYSSVSNVTGELYNYFQISQIVRKHGGLIAVDATQAAAHIHISVSSRIPIDFLVLSSHKVYGPSGVGVLYIRQELQNELEPLVYGSQTFSSVSSHDFKLLPGPAKFEPGTPNIEGIIGLGAAIDWLNEIEHDRSIFNYDQQLVEDFYAIMDEYGLYDHVFGRFDHSTDGEVATFALVDDKIHPHDIAMLLDNKNIAVRAGKACADLLVDHFDRQQGVIRVSLGIYNTADDIERFAIAYKQALKTLNK